MSASWAVKIETNVVIGKSITIDELMDEEGFQAVFIGSGAGLPKFMGIPGENANGVFSANEYLTRNNLMKAFRDDYDTPIMESKKVVVVGGGNVAMDAARTALRLGAEVHIVYRRSEKELPARVEEVHHAKEEGIYFDLLTNPVEILEDENGWVKGIVCRRMELGEPDESGRRRPVEVVGSDFTIDADTVIMALGTSPNPLISNTTKGLEINRWRCIVADESNGKTTKEGRLRRRRRGDWRGYGYSRDGSRTSRCKRHRRVSFCKIMKSHHVDLLNEAIAPALTRLALPIMATSLVQSFTI